MMAEAATFPELTRFYYDEVVTRGHRLMAGVIERGIKNGEFRPVDVMIAAKLAMSPLRSEEHTSELQSPCNLVCRLLLEKKKKKNKKLENRRINKQTTVRWL